MSEEPQKVEVEVPSSTDQTIVDEKKQKKLAGLAKAKEAKKQKALLKKQQEMEDALKNKGEQKSKKEKKKESDSGSEEEVDIETILTALDNTASSKKIDQIHQLLTDLRDMKLKSKEKKKKQKKASTTTTPPPPATHNKIRDKAKSNINTLAGGFGKLTD